MPPGWYRTRGARCPPHPARRPRPARRPPAADRPRRGAVPGRGRPASPRLREEHAAIRLGHGKALALQPADRLDRGGVRNAEPAGDVGGPRLAAVRQQVGDQLDIVLAQCAGLRRTRLAEPQCLGRFGRKVGAPRIRRTCHGDSCEVVSSKGKETPARPLSARAAGDWVRAGEPVLGLPPPCHCEFTPAVGPPALDETSPHRHGRACPHRHQDKPGRGENICRFRRRLGSARSSCARGSASRMARGVRPERLPTTASIASLETRQREQRPWEARSSGGRFQEILANVFGQQNQDQMGIQPTQAACVGAGG